MNLLLEALKAEVAKNFLDAYLEIYSTGKAGARAFMHLGMSKKDAEDLVISIKGEAEKVAIHAAMDTEKKLEGES